MTWENKHLWHIDHIRPCASFDLTIPEQQRQCFKYLNCQPLWAKDNLSKGDKLNWKLQINAVEDELDEEDNFNNWLIENKLETSIDLSNIIIDESLIVRVGDLCHTNII